MGLNGNRNHDLCIAGVVLYQLSFQANYSVVAAGHKLLRVCTIPVKDEFMNMNIILAFQGPT